MTGLISSFGWVAERFCIRRNCRGLLVGDRCLLLGFVHQQFNQDLRKFLKRFGISAQREIEEAVRKGLSDGSLAGVASIKARAQLQIEGTEVNLLIEEDIRIEH